MFALLLLLNLSSKAIAQQNFKHQGVCYDPGVGCGTPKALYSYWLHRVDCVPAFVCGIVVS